MSGIELDRHRGLPYRAQRRLVTLESRPPRVAQAARASLASRDSRPRAEWLRVCLLARRSARFRRIPASRISSSASRRASSGRRTCPCAECARIAPARDTLRQRVALTRREVRKRHLVGAADLGVHMVNLAGKAVRREPFGHGVGFKKRPIDSFRRRPQHTVKSDSVCGHRHGSPRFPRLMMHISPSPLRLYRHSFLPSISRCRGQHGTDTTGHRSVTAQVLLLHRCRC